MELFILILILASLIPLTVLFHELGHAIPAILFSRQKVDVYLGTYGDATRSWKINLRLLDLYFTGNPFLWRSGLCDLTRTNLSVNQQIFCLVAGPFGTLIATVMIGYVVFSNDLYGGWKTFVLFLSIAALIDLRNLVPGDQPIRLADGRLVGNDGAQLQTLFQCRKNNAMIEKADRLFQEKRYKEAVEFIEKVLLKDPANEVAHRLGIQSYFWVKSYSKVVELAEGLIARGVTEADVFFNVAVSYSKMNNHEKALEYYDLALSLNGSHHLSLNNKGYHFLVLEKFEEAIRLFDRAIEIDPTMAYSYSNRGLSKIKLGYTEEGLADIRYSFKLDPNNAYAFRNLGVYYFEKGNYDEALSNFRKAKEMNGDTEMIDQLIVDAETRLKENSPDAGAI